MSPSEILRSNLSSSIEAKQSLMKAGDRLRQFEDACRLIVACYEGGGRLYIAGNGGSAADAQHIAAELVSRLARDRDPLPAEALTVDTSILTAIGNDYGYENVFSRQVRGKMTPKDVFLGITTSGNSSNIREALRACRKIGAKSVVFTGHQGGNIAAANEADFCIVVPGSRVSTIQELHIVLAHSLCECIENAMFSW